MYDREHNLFVQFDSFSCLYPLRKLLFLEEFLLDSNPLCSLSDYEFQVLSILPSLQLLDRSKVSQELRSSAQQWELCRQKKEEEDRREKARGRTAIPIGSREQIIQEARRRWESVKNFVKNGNSGKQQEWAPDPNNTNGSPYSCLQTLSPETVPTANTMDGKKPAAVTNVAPIDNMINGPSSATGCSNNIPSAFVLSNFHENTGSHHSTMLSADESPVDTLVQSLSSSVLNHNLLVKNVNNSEHIDDTESFKDSKPAIRTDGATNSNYVEKSEKYEKKSKICTQEVESFPNCSTVNTMGVQTIALLNPNISTEQSPQRLLAVVKPQVRASSVLLNALSCKPKPCDMVTTSAEATIERGVPSTKHTVGSECEQNDGHELLINKVVKNDHVQATVSNTPDKVVIDDEEKVEFPREVNETVDFVEEKKCAGVAHEIEINEQKIPLSREGKKVMNRNENRYERRTKKGAVVHHHYIEQKKKILRRSISASCVLVHDERHYFIDKMGSHFETMECSDESPCLTVELGTKQHSKFWGSSTTTDHKIHGEVTEKRHSFSSLSKANFSGKRKCASFDGRVPSGSKTDCANNVSTSGASSSSSRSSSNDTSSSEEREVENDDDDTYSVTTSNPSTPEEDMPTPKRTSGGGLMMGRRQLMLCRSRSRHKVSHIEIIKFILVF